MVRDWILAQPAETIAAAQRGMAERRAAEDILTKIATPTLVMVGEHDAISSPAEMRQFAAAMPTAKFVEIPDAGHLSPVENAAQFNRELLDFLAARFH
jgi:pimeloyl-ACP methyl ester carboxylesterase